MKRLLSILILFTFHLSTFAISTAYAEQALVPQTGQTTSYAAGDDGDVQEGVPWPNPRFTDNANGTITDNLTGLVWLKNGNCFGAQAWATAIASANGLASGVCGLTDGSTVGQWRLPNQKELRSLVDLSGNSPAQPFTAVQGSSYWSGSTVANGTDSAWLVTFNGTVHYNYKTYYYYVWPVRSGQ